MVLGKWYVGRLPGASCGTDKLTVLATDTQLFIMGGEFYETINGSLEMFYQGNTLIVDLTTSWTNQTVSSASPATPDGMPYVRQPQLFYDKQRNKISRYGGWPYVKQNDFPSLLWSFTPDGSDNTNWKNETSPAEDGLSAFSPGPFASANAYTQTTYYNLGGNIVPSGTSSMVVLSGLVTRDLVAQDWRNATTDIPNQSQYRTQSKMVHVPNFGTSGYLVVVGGESPPTDVSTYEGGTHMVDMATITLYDIDSKTWYTQTATGDIPPPRSEFCVAGSASASGKRYELFVYGGSTNNTYDLNNPDEDGYLSVYALSLPAFRWFKSNSTTTVRRASHACTVIGNRQMVSVGGRPPSTLQTFGAEQDPWASGLGIFDMTAFAWADHYDSAATSYQSPDVVKLYYNSSYVTPDFSNKALATDFGKW
jgi:hypothetical protein